MWWKEFPVAGVGLIATTTDEQVLLIRENEEKLHLGKVPGMVSFPMETSEPGEEPLATMARLIHEEIPGMELYLQLDLKPAGIYQVVAGIWVLVFWADSNTGPQWPWGLPHGDVDTPHWEPLDVAVTRNLRQGAKEALLDRIARKRNVVCRRCEVPSTLRRVRKLV